MIVVKMIIVSCLLALALGSLALFENVFFTSHTGQLVLYLTVSVIAYKYLCHYVKEKRKEERSKHTSHHNVYDMDYHRIRKSQNHLWRDYEATKRANSELTEENRKLRKESEDKGLALDQMTKKCADLKKELHAKDERLRHGKQKRNTLEDELSQLQEELTVYKNKITSLEEALNNRDHQIKQHKEALKTAIEHVMSDLDDLCTIHNETLVEATKIIVYFNQLVCHLRCLPPPQLAVCSAPVFQYNIDYSLEGNDISQLSERVDEESIPPDHYNSQYTCHALVTNCLSIEEWNYYFHIPMETISYCSEVSSDIYPTEIIPLSLEYMYHDQLVAPSVVLPFPRDGN